MEPFPGPLGSRVGTNKLLASEENMQNYRFLLIGAAVAAAMSVTPDTVLGQDGASTQAMSDSSIVIHGVFAGVDGHNASGSYQLVKEEGRWRVELGDDFRSDRVPDAYVVLAQQADAITSSSVFVTALDDNDGTQSYLLPEEIDPSAFKYLLIWCKKYGVGIGAAPVVEES